MHISLYMILRECKCSVDGIMKKRGQVKVHDSDPYTPGNSCYSFYKKMMENYVLKWDAEWLHYLNYDYGFLFCQLYLRLTKKSETIWEAKNLHGIEKRAMQSVFSCYLLSHGLQKCGRKERHFSVILNASFTKHLWDLNGNVSLKLLLTRASIRAEESNLNCYFDDNVLHHSESKVHPRVSSLHASLLSQSFITAEA